MVDNPRKEKTAAGLARVAAKTIKMRKGNGAAPRKLRTQFGPKGHEDNPIYVTKEQAAELRKTSELRKQGKVKSVGPFTPEESEKFLDDLTSPLEDDLRAFGISLD